MVVNPYHHFIDAYWGSNCNRWRLSYCSIYLYFILMEQNKYKTALVIVSGLLVFYYFFEINILFYVAMAVGILSVFIPKFAAILELAWFKLAYALGWINSRILLTIVFFVFLFPIALLARLFTKDPLQISASKTNSVYSNRDHLYTKEDLKNIW